MISILSQNNKLLIDAYELRIKVAHTKCAHTHNFRRWLDTNVLGNAIHGYDYFIVPEKLDSNKAEFKRKRRNHFYFSLDFAIAVCLMEKSREARNMRHYLIHKKQTLNIAV